MNSLKDQAQAVAGTPRQWAKKIAVAVALCLSLAGCGTSSDGPAGNFIAATSPEALAAGGQSSGPSLNYKIGIGDVVKVTVFQVTDLDRRVQVGGNGLISLPLIGAVQASGRTAQEVESEIAGKLGAKYLQSPQVSVFIEEYNSQKITVGGAVKKPGVFPLRGEMTLMQALAKAEGLEPVADSNKIIVFRQANNRRMVARFEISPINEGRAQDPILQDGDVVMVDSSGVRTTLRDWGPAMTAAGSAAGVFRLFF